MHPPDLGNYAEDLHGRSDANLEQTIDMGFEHTGWPTPQSGWWDRSLEPEEVRAAPTVRTA